MKKIRNHIQNIIWICKPFWKYGKIYIILSICVLGLYSSIDDIIYVRFPEIMIELLSAKKSFYYIAGIAALICGIDFSINIIRKISRGYFTKKETEIDLKVKRDIYEKAMGLDYKYMDNPKYYDRYAWAIQEYAGQVKEGREFLVGFFQCLLSLAVLGTIIGSLGPWIFFLEIAQMILHTLADKQVNRHVINRKKEVLPLDRRLDYFHRLFYVKDYAADMKSTPLSGTVFHEYEQVGKRKRKVVGSYVWKVTFWNCIHEVIFGVTQFIIILYLVRGILSGRIPEVGMYMTLLLSFYRLDTKIDIFTSLVKDASILSMNVEAIREFFEFPSEIETDTKQGEAAPEGSNFSVEFKNVGFSYENSKFALSGLNLSIKPGEKLAIVGENGAGKSTFVKLLLRLYDVAEGEIRINGRPIQAYDVHALRERIGIAFQNTNIYAMSFEDNIALYGKISESTLHEISEKLDLDSILRKNNTTYQAELTREFHDDGIMLSGGEAQKIALARVMSKEFGLLLLDEPSSALDPIAEYKMNQVILSAANKATTIIVAHRLSTIRDVDRIAVLEHGAIKECGTHEELMARHGTYYEMFTKQAENYVKQ